MSALETWNAWELLAIFVNVLISKFFTWLTNSLTEGQNLIVNLIVHARNGVTTTWLIWLAEGIITPILTPIAI